jgi:hypothetical protein
MMKGGITMKFKKNIIICTFCILLSGCSKYTKSDKPATTNQENSAQDTNTTLAPTAKPTIAPTQTIPTTTPVPEVSSVTPLPHVYLDYSGHTDPNESSYITKLADLSALKDSKPIFSVKEPPADWSDYEFAGFDQGDPTWGYDVRSCDISNEDLSVVDDFSKLSFNTDTIWPKILPDGFDPNQILEYNKNPGLGIQELHKEGITGKGVGIAIIDLTLLLDHEQYKDNLCSMKRYTVMNQLHPYMALLLQVLLSVRISAWLRMQISTLLLQHSAIIPIQDMNLMQPLWQIQYYGCWK